MHRQGNTLDLIISEIQGSATVMTTAPGLYITDHRAIISTLNIKKVQPKRQDCHVRSLHTVTTYQWKEEFKAENVMLSANLNDSVASLSKEFNRMMEKLAPVKKCSISLKPKKPWFNKDLATEKAKVRHHEKKGLKHKLPATWTAYTKVRNSYYGKLNSNKKAIIRQQISDCANDSKKLYSLISNLTSKPMPTPWPDHTDKESLAEDFTDFFQTKILQIRKQFDGIEQYNTTNDTSAPRLHRFAPLTEKEVMIIIKQMKTKSCELDDLPTDILKQILPIVILLITKIINLSLEQGESSESWKNSSGKTIAQKTWA